MKRRSFISTVLAAMGAGVLWKKPARAWSGSVPTPRRRVGRDPVGTLIETSILKVVPRDKCRDIRIYEAWTGPVVDDDIFIYIDGEYRMVKVIEYDEPRIAGRKRTSANER